jgi:hypothetical protein
MSTLPKIGARFLSHNITPRQLSPLRDDLNEISVALAYSSRNF